MGEDLDQQDALKISDVGRSCIAVQDDGTRPLEAGLSFLVKNRCTHSYASPEMLREEDYDFNCDV